MYGLKPVPSYSISDNPLAGAEAPFQRSLKPVALVLEVKRARG
jgi:hypothetical protein